jgi:integrase
MPSKSKGARLWLRPAKGKQRAVWIIRDGKTYRSTGCSPDQMREAEQCLATYLGGKHDPTKRGRSLDQIEVADVISIYLDEVAPGQAKPHTAAARAKRLLGFFGRLSVADVTRRRCQEYAKHRGNNGGARRDLQDLGAALTYARRVGLYREVIDIWTPAAGPARSRFLTRSEVARLLWVCLTTRGQLEGRETLRRPLRHLARFILVGVYTGSRPGAILGLNWDRTTHRGWVDLEHGLIYRKPTDMRETTKRQPPIPIAPELHRMMARWAARDGGRGPVVSYNGEPVLRLHTALTRAVKLAGLDASVSAYTLRHTTASWLVQKGVSSRKAAEVLGTSEQYIERNYGHLSPEHLRAEVALIGRK